MKGVRICSMLILVLFGVWTLPVGCGGGGGDSGSTTTPPASGSNVQPITVNGGPTAAISGGYIYPNAAFTSVTVCVHDTSNCQTIDGVLVDTGSFGLRLLSSALSSTLYKTPTAGSNLGECVQFADGSYLWGSVQTFDVKLSGELASSAPIHVLDPNFYTVPSDCSSGGGSEEDDLLSLGANGILGIGPFQYDCGSTCVPGSGSPQTGTYYECSASSGCQATFVSLSQQVQNPVALFSTDNNGVIIELPAVSGPTASVNGSMVFGIDTQSNNGLGSATVLTLNQYQSINTTYKGTVMPYSSIDTGSNAYFFPDISIPQDYYGWYVPATTQSLTATNEGYNGNSSTVSFSVGNADNMFNANPNYAVLNTLAGYSYGYFDWGLPFFYGRNVYTAIDTKNTLGPYFAY